MSDPARKRPHLIRDPPTTDHLANLKAPHNSASSSSVSLVSRRARVRDPIRGLDVNENLIHVGAESIQHGQPESRPALAHRIKRDHPAHGTDPGTTQETARIAFYRT